MGRPQKVREGKSKTKSKKRKGHASTVPGRGAGGEAAPNKKSAILFREKNKMHRKHLMERMRD